MKKSIAYLLLGIAIMFMMGCPVKRATLKTFVEPSIEAEAIQTVAIFPIRNMRLLPDEARELNRGVTQAFSKQNPAVKIIGPSESSDLLNQAELADKYSDFLRDYATSGIPNSNTLQKIGSALGADALLQGEIYDIKQVDGAYGWNKGTTSLTVRYVLLGTKRGTVLWEATSEARLMTATTIENAPPMYEAILAAQNRILSALPSLGR